MCLLKITHEYISSWMIKITNQWSIRKMLYVPIQYAIDGQIRRSIAIRESVQPFAYLFRLHVHNMIRWVVAVGANVEPFQSRNQPPNNNHLSIMCQPLCATIDDTMKQDDSRYLTNVRVTLHTVLDQEFDCATFHMHPMLVAYTLRYHFRPKTCTWPILPAKNLIEWFCRQRRSFLQLNCKRVECRCKFGSNNFPSFSRFAHFLLIVNTIESLLIVVNCLHICKCYT
jgi:hypothetical protein